MGALENCSAKLPPGNRAAIHSKVLGKLPLAPARQTALTPKPLRDRLAYWKWVIAKEPDEHRNGANWGFVLSNSQFMTVNELTPIRLAACCCDRPRRWRRFLTC